MRARDGRPGGGRIQISPTSPDGSGRPVSSVTRISPRAARPTEPRWASHSRPVITVLAGESEAPYSSKIRSGPSQSIHASFNHSGQDDAMWNTVRSADRSIWRVSAGSRQMRCIIVGTSSTNSAR